MSLSGAQTGPRREPLVLDEASAGRASVIVAAGFLLSTVLSGVLGLLIGIVLGETPETDALLSAYSLYLVFTLFGANLRVALVPIVGSTADEPAFRRRAEDVARRLSTLGAVLALGLLVLSPALGHLLVAGIDDARPDVAGWTLALLAVASYCQIAAASMGSVLAAARRFTGSAALYVAGAAVTVATAAALMPAFGAIGAAIGVLAGAILLYAGHVALLRRHDLHPRPGVSLALQRRTWRLGGAAAAGASTPLAYQAMLTIALAALSGPVGTVTAYSYAYFFAALLSTVTAASIGFVTMPNLVADLERRPAAAARDYLRAVSPVGVLLYVPLGAAAATFGRPVLDAVLDGPLGVETVDLLWDLLRIFTVVVLFWVVLTPVPTLALALKRFRPLALIAVVSLPVQAALVTVLDGVGGPTWVAVAHGAVTIAVAVAAGGVVFGAGTPAALGDAFLRVAPGVALAGLFPLLAWAVPADGVVVAIALSVLGVGLYLAAAALVWPAVARPLMRQLLGIARRTHRTAPAG